MCLPVIIYLPLWRYVEIEECHPHRLESCWVHCVGVTNVSPRYNLSPTVEICWDRGVPSTQTRKLLSALCWCVVTQWAWHPVSTDRVQWCRCWEGFNTWWAQATADNGSAICTYTSFWFTRGITHHNCCYWLSLKWMYLSVCMLCQGDCC